MKKKTDSFIIIRYFFLSPLYLSDLSLSLSLSPTLLYYIYMQRDFQLFSEVFVFIDESWHRPSLNMKPHLFQHTLMLVRLCNCTVLLVIDLTVQRQSTTRHARARTRQ